MEILENLLIDDRLHFFLYSIKYFPKSYIIVFQRISLTVSPDIRIEDALLNAEVVLEHRQEFNLQLCTLSMDMLKVVGTIDHQVLIGALRSKGLPDAYIALLFLLYANQ